MLESKIPSPPRLFYRIEISTSASWDDETETIAQRFASSLLRSFPVLKETPKGVWLSLNFGKKRFVRLDTVKKFAHPTIEEARQAFLARNARYIEILHARLREALVLRTIVREGFLGRNYAYPKRADGFIPTSSGPVFLSSKDGLGLPADLPQLNRPQAAPPSKA